MSLGDFANAINTRHAAVVNGLRRTVDDARIAGEYLIAAKDRLAHGEWLPWLKEHCPDVSAQVAQRYMRIARKWSDLGSVNAYSSTHLGVNEALALLAEPREIVAPGPVGEPAGTWRVLPTCELHVSDPGWRYDNTEVAGKLRESFRLYGQVAPVVVRTIEEGVREVVDGRKRLQIMRDLEFDEIVVLDVGAMPVPTAQKVAMALDLRFQTDYAAVAHAVSGLLDGGDTPESLEAACPWDAERLRGFKELATFDWSRFAAKDENGSATPTLYAAEVPQAPEWEYRCPRCGTEWSGKPRPWRAGGMAMSNARDRRNGKRSMRLTFEIGEHQSLEKQLRMLAEAYGTTDLAETVALAVRLASDRIAAEPGHEQ